MPVSAHRVWLNNGNPLSGANQVPIDCKDSATRRADKPCCGVVSISRRSSQLYEPEQIPGLGRTSSERHCPMGVRGRPSRFTPS